MKSVYLTLVAALAGLSLVLTAPASACGSCGFSMMFKANPAKERFVGQPRPVQFEGHDLGRTLSAAEKEKIRAEVAQGPNFAGAYRLVVLPCGDICKTILVVSAETGRIYRLPETRLFWAEFDRESNLIIVSALQSGDMRLISFVFENGRFRRAPATS
jgi:hypothetical protein